MICKLSISGLKSIDHAEFELEPFTLLVGMNSSGKSTVIQSLLLAIQNITEKQKSPLNGQLVALGSLNEATNFMSNAKKIQIALTSVTEELLTLELIEDDQQALCNVLGASDGLKDYLHRRNKRIHYLAANRIGAQDTYSKSYSHEDDYGSLGEYAIDYFENHKKDIIEADLMKDVEIGSTLEIHVNYWMSYIINGQVSTEDLEGTDKVKAQFQYVGNRKVRPKNIGSGLSYIVSIIIGILSAKKGDLFIIENPEIHLHPRAQSRLTELFAFAARQGIRFVIETHSDHLFNGIRKAIYKKHIEKELVSVYFFQLDKDFISRPLRIQFHDNGNVANHQPGLFDQFDDDLDEMLGL
ncbi:DUF3696 domain-containing protein [Paenibacillus sp. A3]|uniref:AAA family ATPase n=1 Tax=Paenibacillus sp. A3 TaxID=1337054 RepID=UPI0006D53F8D|nr:DUF3696 domain-containing protein [Paenibacillus sp. A3]